MEHSNRWIADAYVEYRLTISQISDITGKNEKNVRRILESFGVIGGSSPKLKRVGRRKRNRKAAIIFSGGKCTMCGYNKCEAALEFHHKNDGTDKNFTVSSGYSKSWEELKKELAKCILVCSNCHKELHNGENNDKSNTV